MNRRHEYFVFLILFTAYASTACSPLSKQSVPPFASRPDLAAHSAEFEQGVVKVTEGVWSAIGYGLANSILIEGETGVIIVDTMESAEAARKVKEAFARVTAKPLKAIIYTHFHPDHTFGTSVFTEGKPVDIYAHESTLALLDKMVSVTRDVTYKRGVRQFGTMLPKDMFVNSGIGPFLDFGPESTVALVRPNKTFPADRTTLTIEGVRLELIHAPGETDDQIVVWIPDKKVLLCADNYYKSFPNLYAIRGTPYRDVLKWVSSIDTMRFLNAEYLVPCHTRPVIGKKTIYETLTNYRDAIAFVHDQTVRGINQGFGPDELVERVKLPDHLARLPYLQEYYGTVQWSVRAIYDGYLGWFDGNATNLFPLPPKGRAERMATLAGGNDALLKIAQESTLKGDHQWALELVDHVLALQPDMPEAVRLKADLLVVLGSAQLRATAHNYYLTQALELKGAIRIDKRPIKEKDVVHSVPLDAIFAAMAVNLDPVRSADVDEVVAFRFPDVNRVYSIHVRHGVAEIQPFMPERPQVTLTVDSKAWKEIASGMRSPVMAFVKGDVKVEGGTFDLVRFLNLFKPG